MNDGKSTFTFVGCMYLENKLYFIEENFDIKEIDSEDINNFGGNTIYLISPSESIVLNESEIRQSEDRYKDNESKCRKCKTGF